MKKRVKIAHPSNFVSIEELKKEQVANEVKMFQYATGGKRRKTVKKY